jgi:hypothetical protein
MFEGDSADMCAEKFPLMSMGGRAEGLACADPGARTPIGMSGIFTNIYVCWYHLGFQTKKIWHLKHLLYFQQFVSMCSSNSFLSFVLNLHLLQMEVLWESSVSFVSFDCPVEVSFSVLLSGFLMTNMCFEFLWSFKLFSLLAVNSQTVQENLD